MKKEIHRPPTTRRHRRYPSLREHFDHETEAAKKNPVSRPAAVSEWSFHLVYLRVIAALATAMAIATLVAKA